MVARINFVELPSSRFEASNHFYAEAFGWQLTAFGPAYASTLTGDVNLGLQADPGEATRGPLVVIAVDDLGRSLQARHPGSDSPVKGINPRLAPVKPGCMHQGGCLATITMKELLEAGVHFGHQTKRWDPRM